MKPHMIIWSYDSVYIYIYFIYIYISIMYKCTSQNNTITIPGTVVSLFVVKGTSIRRAQSRTGSSLFKMGPGASVFVQMESRRTQHKAWNQGGHNGNMFKNRIIQQPFFSTLWLKALLPSSFSFPVRLVEAISYFAEVYMYCNSFVNNICISYPYMHIYIIYV